MATSDVSLGKNVDLKSAIMLMIITITIIIRPPPKINWIF